MAVKESVFPFARFAGVDVILGPEMKSTGEVMGIADDYASAFAKSQLAAGVTLPELGHGVHLGEGRRQAGAWWTWPGACAPWASAGGHRAARTRTWRPRASQTEQVLKVTEGRPEHRRQDRGRARSSW